ncbi:MAG TPA: ATP-binding protein [Candidatus Saccharimonadales bacterium]|nr:ATP-binding protein [Candidatus Saccharimonadales bacterium]
MFRSATFKLTMWYLAIVMAISLAFSAAVYHFASRELVQDLTRQSLRIAQRYPVFDNDQFWREGADATAGSHRILFDLLYFNILVLIGAGIASYLLARQTLEPIEQAHEQQKRFTADVSHELRTPLTAIKMSSEVALLDGAATKLDLRNALTSNIEEADKLNALINNLLRLTQLDAGELQQSLEAMTARSLVETAIQSILPISTSRNIAISTDIPNLMVRADKESFVQLLVILLDNAIKYSPENTTVTLHAERKGQYALFSVIDQGIGISPDALKHVFDRFYRADGSRQKTSTDGFGLGLSIAKMIADLHGATITITSQVGKGTTASVSLPIEEQHTQVRPKT